ncbi:MAG: hypothetical protein WCF93_02265, partial [Candidatus Moraniibacteriota bacterium]
MFLTNQKNKNFNPKNQKSIAKWVVLLFSFCVGIFVFTNFSQAATGINKQINYQGKLTDGAGVSVADGSYNFKISLYTVASGGTPVWTARGTVGTPTARVVTLTNGVFSIMLGDTVAGDNAMTIDFSQDAYYLGITVGTDAEMTSRKRIGAVPQAINSNNLIGDGFINIAGLPTGSTVSGGTVYVNPASATSGYTLLGLAVNGTEKFKVTEAGNVSTAGSINGQTISSAANFTGSLTMNGAFANSSTTNSYFMGNVGIGTTSPGAKLHLFLQGDTANPVLYIRRGNNSGGGAGNPEIGIDVSIPNTYNSAGTVYGIRSIVNHNLGGPHYAGYFEAAGNPYGNGIGVYAKTTHTDTNGPGFQSAIFADAYSNIGISNAGYAVAVQANTNDYVNNVNLFLKSNYTGASDQNTVIINRNGNDVGYIRTNTTASSFLTSSSSGLIGIDANAVAINTASNERVRITSGGNVGIGTTTPANKLDIIGNLYSSGFAGFGNGATPGSGSFFDNTISILPHISSVNTTTNTTDREAGIWSQLFLNNSVDNAATKYGIMGNVEVLASNSMNSPTRALRGVQGAVDHVGSGTLVETNGGIFFSEIKNSGTITLSTGVVGNSLIDTTGTMTYAVGVQGNINVFTSGGHITNTAKAFNTTIDNYGTIATAYGLYVSAPTGTGTITNKYAIATEPGAGNVGIGTTTPLAKLSVLGGDSLNTSFGLNVSGATGIGLVVTNGNNVGIGTTTPSKSLTVNGNVLLQSTTNTANAFDIQNSSGTSILNVNSAHNWVGINKSPVATLDVAASSPSYFDDFESGVLSPFSSVSAKPFTASTAYAYAGNYAAGVFMNQGDGDNSILSLSKTLNSVGTISFYYKCSNDFPYDSSVFYIDGNADNSLCSGGQTKDWTLASYPLSSGAHTFYWKINYTNALIANEYLFIDNVEITNSGTGIAALFNGGNVGIGTITPVGKLDIKGAGTTTGIALQTQDSTGKLGLSVLDSGVTTIKGSSVTDGPTLGSELLTGGTWTSTGWTGDNSSGWVHTTGNVSPLSYSATVTPGNLYQIAVTRTGGATGRATMTIGGVEAGEAGTIWDYAGGEIYYHVPQALTTDGLVITPDSTFDGTITVSVKEITAISTPLFALQDSTGGAFIEMRGTSDSYNTFIGRNSGGYNTLGNDNTAQGTNALAFNTTGYGNSAQGADALSFNTTGYYNSAQGYEALFFNTTGYYNSAQGADALVSNATGSNNSAQGVEALFSNITGSYNSAQGTGALLSNTTGNDNSAQGADALYSNTTGSYNSAQGVEALLFNTTGNYNSAQGYQAGRYITDGTTANATGSNSIFLGASTRAHANGETNQIVIGDSAIGAGSNTVTLGNDSITKTLLKGNVGIGTITPAGKLDIKGAGTTTGIALQTQDSTGKLGLSVLDSGVTTIKGSSVTDGPTLGSELLTGGTWTSTGWTGDNSSGWVHTTGNVSPLSYSATVTPGNLYQIAVTRTGGATGRATMTIGGVEAGEAGTIWDYAGGEIYYHVPQALTTDGLVITPDSTFDGTITVSVKEITAISTPLFALQDSTGGAFIEMRGTSDSYNTFIGRNSGGYNTLGNDNTAQGTNALAFNTTGGGNSAQGAYALASNTTGGGNSAQGVSALYFNTTGSSNSAQGDSALFANTEGNYNSAQGVGALYFNTTGSSNSAQGDSA